MAELPSGTVTFLFTDLEGSTRLWEQHPDGMRAALARHDEILRDAIGVHDGSVVKMTGDGIHAVFGDASDAVGAAVAAQLALDAETWALPEPLKVRMGLHSGPAELRDGDYYGTAVNRAARIMSVAHGGQIIVSLATEELVQDTPVKLVDLGEHRLRDLSRAERVFQVRAPGLQDDFPALASLDAIPGNLPLQVSSFVGREREVARAIEALRDGRVVTLVGVGGVGKTRLALQVAAEIAPGFREGAWLVELATVRDPAGVADAVAAVLGVGARSGQTVSDALVEFLATKQLLLVLDNCEHLLDAAAQLLERIERSCRGVVVLATSREGLALDGEQLIAVPSLVTPAETADLGAITAAESVLLFVERARRVDADFGLTAQNAAAVGQVCRRLDGVPLAIELAAARVATMSPAELARGLDRRFEMLSGRRRGAVLRHQTLRAAIDWSYELLSEPERRLQARLAVFVGGCTREAAEAVCAGDPVDERAVFALLSGLVTKSLVLAERDGPETRYRLLETIREYGEERLVQHAEADTMRTRHAEYYAELAGVLLQEIAGPHQIEVGRRLAAERDNVLAATRHAIDTDSPDLALRLLTNTPGIGTQIDYQLRLPAEAVLSLNGASEHPLFPVGLAVAALYAASRGEGDAEALCEQALAAARRMGLDPDDRVDVHVAFTRMLVAASIGAHRDAATHAQHAAEAARSAGWLGLAAAGLSFAAVSQTLAGHADAAIPIATEGLEIARQVAMPIFIAQNLAALAGALADQDPHRAQALLDESVQLRATLGYDAQNEAVQAVLVSARLQNWPQALTLAPRSIRHLHWSGDQPQLAGILNVVARALVASDAESSAVLQGAARRLAIAGFMAFDRSQSAHEIRRPAADTATATPTGPAGFISELRRTTTGLLHETLSDARLRDLRAEGEAMDTDEVVAFALTAIEHASPDPEI